MLTRLFCYLLVHCLCCCLYACLLCLFISVYARLFAMSPVCSPRCKLCVGLTLRVCCMCMKDGKGFENDLLVDCICLLTIGSQRMVRAQLASLLPPTSGIRAGAITGSPKSGDSRSSSSSSRSFMVERVHCATGGFPASALRSFQTQEMQSVFQSSIWKKGRSCGEV